MAHLLATMLERVNDLLWLKTKDAHKKPPRNRPKRIQRPGVDDRDDMSKALGGRKQQIVPMANFSSLWKQARQAWLDRKKK